MITLLGATGYTGIRTARVLDRRGLPFRLAGRDAQKLAALSESLSTKPAYLTVNLDQASSITDLFRQTEILINCAGPFTDLGERIVSQAAVKGAHYIDSSNELGYLVRMRSYNRLAQKSKAVISPACAFEVALSDTAARLLINPETPNDEVRVYYHIKASHTSIGTRKSALRALATSWMTYRGGRWVGQAPVSRSTRVTIDGTKLYAISIPSGESVTIPEHLTVQTVSTWLTVPFHQYLLGPIFLPYYARFLRSIAGPWIQNLLGIKSPDPVNLPDETSSFVIKLVAKSASDSSATYISGKNPYQVTGEILAYAAQVLRDNPPDQGGVLPPSAILGSSFFDDAKEWGVKVFQANED